MSLFQCIRRLIRSNNYNVNSLNNNEPLEEPLDDPPEYENPPEYEDNHDMKHIDEKTIQKSKTTISIDKIINNIRNNKYNLGCVILDDTTPSPSKVIKYLVKNYATSKDIMLYMIKNEKHNHIVRINKEIFDTKQNKLFFIGPINLNIQINDNIFNFSKYKCAIFSTIFMNETGWQGNAIHHIGLFDGTAVPSNTIVNIDNFIKLF
jgi:hypothetical protein